MMKIGKCQNKTTVTRVKVEEKRRKAIFLNLQKQEYIRTKIDGCLVRGRLASDWIVSKIGVGDIIIELKGADVDHAVEQILATAEDGIAQKLANGCLAALIVCNQYPRFDTKIQRATQIFVKKYKAPLHIVSKNLEFTFEKVLRFDGPL